MAGAKSSAPVRMSAVRPRFIVRECDAWEFVDIFAS